MKIEIKSFRTKIAHRIFTLFIICAILPFSVLAVISFGHVRKQLNEQSRNQLQRETKSVAVSISERILLIRAEMEIVASSLLESALTPDQISHRSFAERLREQFSGLAIVSDKGVNSLIGTIQDPPKLNADEKKHIISGKPLLHLVTETNSRPRIYMFIFMDPGDARRGVLMGEVNKSYLWESAARIPFNSELCIVDQSNNILFTSNEGLSDFQHRFFKDMTASHTGQFEWSYEGTKYISSYYSIFLQPTFYYPKWKVLLSKSVDDMLTPMWNFKVTFIFLLILSLAMVFYLSMSIIKRNMGPIEILRTATQKIANGDFGHKVTIKTGDEFEALGSAFNEMSEKLKKGQDLLVRSEKLSTIGHMAAGVIHEIKQPVTGISGILQISLMEKRLSEKEEERFKMALSAVKRLNDILSRFQSFSHTAEKEMAPVSVNKVIDDVIKIMEHELRVKNIQWVEEYGEGIPFVLGNKSRLQQVFSNLLINAIHALENKVDDQSVIKIKTYTSGSKVFVEFEDNGCGIPEEIQPRIFDPFFTTKEPDKGSGLGLAIVASIIHEHDAEIKLKSEVGFGTKFTLIFAMLRKKEMP